MRIHRYDHAPRPLSWLPNRVGNFMGVKFDGSQMVCRVEIAPDGSHRVADGALAELKGWLPMPMVGPR